MTAAATIQFSAPLYVLKSVMVIRLPETASAALPSRGQVSMHGHINDYEFETVVEPDGYWGHWLKIDPDLQQAAHLVVGSEVRVCLTKSAHWPEPELPQDVAVALRTAPSEVEDKWRAITSMARWEWIRWITATANPDTRATRIVKTISKLNGSHRRPCCFNRAACTDPKLSKNGRLIEPIIDRKNA